MEYTDTSTQICVIIFHYFTNTDYSMNNFLNVIFLVILALIAAADLAIVKRNKNCDTPRQFRPQSMEERLHQSQFVLYGIDVKHEARGNDKVVSKFQVYCVFKYSGDLIPENITINNIAAENSCSGTYIKEKNAYIVGLDRSSKNEFDWHLNGYESYAFAGTHRNLMATRRMCGMTTLSLPSGRHRDSDPKCPEDLNKSIACTAGPSSSVSITYSFHYKTSCTFMLILLLLIT